MNIIGFGGAEDVVAGVGDIVAGNGLGIKVVSNSIIGIVFMVIELAIFMVFFKCFFLL